MVLPAKRQTYTRQRAKHPGSWQSVAVFADGKHAIDNECARWRAPSEGVVGDGCVVCPWHGV
jgi:nitrite reductase/ring-hydroxylating ferredoxin subunit